QVGAVVLAAERPRCTGVAVHEMGIEAVVTGRPLEAVEHRRETRARLSARHPSVLAGHDQGHHAKARAAGRDHVVRWVGEPAGAIAREPARRLSAVPEIEEGLALDEIEQALVGELLAVLGGFGRGY